MRIAVLTFAVGKDYLRAMEPGLASKRAYCARHGYTFLEGGAEVWDRTKPIPWSKLNFIRKHLDDYDYLFWTDGDVIITNPEIRLEDVFLPLLGEGTDMIWCRDACGNLNNGNVFFRGKSAWARDFLTRCYAQDQFTHHIWWDNAAFCFLYETNAEDRAHIHTCEDPALFNAYLFDRQNSAESTTVRLYRPGDFLVHFAGVYDTWNIHRCMIYLQRCAAAGRAPNAALLTHWRTRPPLTQQQAAQEGATAPIY